MVFELEEALGERVQTCELLGRNWRNWVYRVQLATGDAALAKQVVMGTDGMLQCQYGQLGVLATLQIPPGPSRSARCPSTRSRAI